MGFKEDFDKRNLEYIIEDLCKQKEIKGIKNLLNKNGKIKDDISDENIELLFKTIVLNIDFNERKNYGMIYSIIINRTITNDVLKYIMKEENLEPEFYYYISGNPACSNELMKELLTTIAEQKNIKPLIEHILSRIEDKDILLKYSNDIDMHSSILKNESLDNKLINNIIDVCLKEVINNKTSKKEEIKHSNYKITNHFNEIISKNELEESNFSKLIEISKLTDSSYFLTELAKKDNITKEAIDYIATYENEGETNSRYARTELIHNPNVDVEIKAKIIENQNKYKIANSNDFNLSDYIQTMNDFFNKS